MPLLRWLGKPAVRLVCRQTISLSTCQSLEKESRIHRTPELPDARVRQQVTVQILATLCLYVGHQQ